MSPLALALFFRERAGGKENRDWNHYEILMKRPEFCLEWMLSGLAIIRTIRAKYRIIEEQVKVIELRWFAVAKVFRVSFDCIFS